MDKLLHFIVSYLMTLVSPVGAFLAGIGKEVYDLFSGGDADILDLFADWAGLLLCLTLF